MWLERRKQTHSLLAQTCLRAPPPDKDRCIWRAHSLGALPPLFGSEHLKIYTASVSSSFLQPKMGAWETERKAKHGSGRTGGRWLKVNDLGPWLAAKLWIRRVHEGQHEIPSLMVGANEKPFTTWRLVLWSQCKGWKLCLAVGFRRDAREKIYFQNEIIRTRNWEGNPHHRTRGQSQWLILVHLTLPSKEWNRGVGMVTCWASGKC